MRKNYLKDPKLKTLTSNIENLFNVTNKALNCSLGKIVDVAPNQTMVCDFSQPIKKIYYTTEGVYAHTQTHALMKYDTKTQQISTVAGALGEQLLVEEIIYNGQKTPLYLCERGGYAGVNEFSLPFGRYLAIHKNRCFTANANTVSFCGPFDFSDYSFSELNGAFNTEEKDGEKRDQNAAQDQHGAGGCAAGAPHARSSGRL